MFQYSSNRKAFQHLLNGKKTDLFLLENGKGCQAAITNYGARLVSLEVPDKKGHLTDVILGYNSLQEYLQSTELYYGAIIGRVANRIGKGYFILDGATYQLEQNNFPNHLHGGSKGFHNQVWEVRSIKSNTLVLGYTSVDGEEGYPGNVQVEVTYFLAEDNALHISYKANTDKVTLFNITNHAYFNLSGDGSGTVLDHEVWIDADKITALDEHSTPTGTFVDVENTPFDFRAPKTLGRDIDVNHQILKWGNGYDQNFVLNKKPQDFKVIARASGFKSGICLEVETTEPGMQLYTANYLSGKDYGKNGAYQARHAFCFETQHFPDAPNHSHFPSIKLLPNKPFSSRTVYRFITLPIGQDDIF